MGGWFDGWVGGVVGACLAVALTIWWDARVRRSEKLDEAVAVLAAAALDFQVEVSRTDRGPQELDRELLGATRGFILSLLLVQARAFRLRLGPSRGFALTIRGLSDMLVGLQQGGIAERDWPQISEISNAVQLACFWWMRSPGAFRDRRDLSQKFLRQAGGADG